MTQDPKVDGNIIMAMGYNEHDNPVTLRHQMATIGAESLHENNCHGSLHCSNHRANEHCNERMITSCGKVVFDNQRNDITHSNCQSLPLSRPNQNTTASNLTFVDHGGAMPSAQIVQSLGFVPHTMNMSANYQQHQINTLSTSLNTAGVTLNNLAFPAFRNAMFVPDANISLQNAANSCRSGYNAQFCEADSIPVGLAQKHHNHFNGIVTVMGENTSSVYGGERSEQSGEIKSRSTTSEEGSQSTTNGQLDSDKTTINNITNTEIESNRKQHNERRGLPNLPLAKRMRQTEEKQLRQIQPDWSVPTKSGLWMSGLSYGISCLLYTESDDRNLSQYQCLARQQMEVFQATPDDAGNNAQGRNKPILPGQVGIRCRHCYKLPPKERKTGSVYYPNRLEGVYQTAQKMTVGHLIKHCSVITEDIRERLIFLKNQKSSDGGGKRYWANGVRMLGVIETPNDGLAFQKPSSQMTHLGIKKPRENNLTISTVI